MIGHSAQPEFFEDDDTPDTESHGLLVPPAWIPPIALATEWEDEEPPIPPARSAYPRTLSTTSRVARVAFAMVILCTMLLFRMADGLSQWRALVLCAVCAAALFAAIAGMSVEHVVYREYRWLRRTRGRRIRTKRHATSVRRALRDIMYGHRVPHH